MGGYVYILTNNSNTVLYTGVTSDLPKRMAEHAEHVNPRSFTARYNVHKLVYCEHYSDITDAIRREKQIKSFVRVKKIRLIESLNPDWNDLYVSL